MKKTLLIVLLLIFVVGLAACSEKNPDQNLDNEFDRISSLIPTEFEETILLPEAASGYNVTYKIDDIELENSTLQYEIIENDKTIMLVITISNDLNTEEYAIFITQVGSVSKYNEYQINLYFEDIFYRIEYNIPLFVTSNFELPSIEETASEIIYTVDCTTIERGYVVYTFPSVNTDCLISAEVTYQNQTRTQDFVIVMSSIDNLPKIPEIHITTENNDPVLNNFEYVRATLSLDLHNHTQYKPLFEVPLGIRLRGNSTIGMPKKAFKIKFDEKQKLLSLYSEKDWVLLGNYVDHTLIRNYLAFNMASKLDMEFTPMYTFVDVYLNNVYLGNYLLTDQIEVTNDRVNIEENSPTIDTGYLIELDLGLYRIGLENTDDNYFLIDGIPFVLHSPDYTDEHYLVGQKEYIEGYINTVLDTLENHEDYSNLIDEDTFIDWFIVNEVFKNVDAGYSSVYFFKDKEGLLKMGPVWDFDISSGVPGYIPDRGPEGWYAAREDKNIFLYYLMQYPSFRDNLKDRWNDVYETKIRSVLYMTHYISNSITHSRYKNFELWDVIGKDFQWYTSPEIYDIKTYDEQVWFLYDYLDERTAWLNEEINNLD